MHLMGEKRIDVSSKHSRRSRLPVYNSSLSRKCIPLRLVTSRSSSSLANVLTIQYSFIWPDSELSLQNVVDAHEGPQGAFEALRTDHQCSIRCDLANSTIIIQGMQERDVTEAGRKFEAIARQMIAEMSHFIKISLVRAPPALLDQSIVTMNQEVRLKTALYHLPIPGGPNKDVFMVKTPKLLTPPSSTDKADRLRSEKMVKRLDRFNRDTILAGLERSLTNLNFVQKAVRMQVDFGQLAFLRYRSPQGSQHHSFESFRKTMGKDRTDLILQAYVFLSGSATSSLANFHRMPPHLSIPTIIDRLRKHPALKADSETSANVNETYVVAFDFRRPDGNEVLRHEQEFGESAKKDEMEMRRRSWVRMSPDSDRTSPLILSVLDFQKYVDILALDSSKNTDTFQTGLATEDTSSRHPRFEAHAKGIDRIRVSY